MNATAKAALWVVRLSVLLGLVLGVVLWIQGRSPALTNAHVAVGFVLDIGLWAWAARAALRGAPRGLVTVAALWGLLLPVVGFGQLRWMPGAAHWVIQVVHLLIGLGAAGMAESLAKRGRVPGGRVG